MPIKKLVKILSIIVIGCAALFAVLFFSRPVTLTEKTVPAVWREDFVSASALDKTAVPKGWKLEKKLGARPAIFSVKREGKEGFSFLHMEADRASASLITKVDNVSLDKTPIMRWRWRATALPRGADGRVKAKDDQAIGIYVGTGILLNNKSVSYRWDTETPKGAEGDCAYGLGVIKIKWYTLRSKEDAGNGRWFTEERNVAEDFKKAWGFYPGTVYLSFSCNSQYTGSRAAADLEWIEFISSSGKAI